MDKKQKQLKFIKAYKNNLGNISKCCEEVEISRDTYYRWMKTKKFKKMFQEAMEYHNDLVWQGILKKARVDLDNDLLKFWAKHQMKHRGFIEQTDINLSGELKHNIEKIEVEIIDGNSKNSIN